MKPSEMRIDKAFLRRRLALRPNLPQFFFDLSLEILTKLTEKECIP
jgi:hypothetical protein